MNILNKFVISFVLPFLCLLISVSNAEIEPSLSYSSYLSSNSSNVSSIGSYTTAQIQTYVDSYIAGTSTELETAMQELIDNQIISRWYCYQYGKWNSLLLVSYGSNIEVFLRKDTLKSFLCCTNNSGASYYLYTNGYLKEHTNLSGGNVTALSGSYDTTFYGLDYSVKYLDYTSSSNSYSWDGTSYYYEVPTEPDEPDTPSLPSNAEIAQVVQAFYDSDLYKNNSNFKDFMVVYSFITGYYSIIGTDNHLLQEIYYDGAKPSNEDFTYPETWWRFYNYFGNAQNLFYGWDYWLYSTRKEDDSFSPISYDGVGKINDLFKLKFTNQSIIVYSSYEYKVYEFRPPTEEGGSNSSTVTTIPGDEYTYDENLDPTDSEYSPIQNYIPTNPSQTILGDVDFNEINKTFEENKGILNIENARWLFTANNQFVGYFIGFLSLLIVFLIISRILGG